MKRDEEWTNNPPSAISQLLVICTQFFLSDTLIKINNFYSISITIIRGLYHPQCCIVMLEFISHKATYPNMLISTVHHILKFYTVFWQYSLCINGSGLLRIQIHSVLWACQPFIPSHLSQTFYPKLANPLLTT